MVRSSSASPRHLLLAVNASPDFTRHVLIVLLWRSLFAGCWSSAPSFVPFGVHKRCFLYPCSCFPVRETAKVLALLAQSLIFRAILPCQLMWTGVGPFLLIKENLSKCTEGGWNPNWRNARLWFGFDLWQNHGNKIWRFLSFHILWSNLWVAQKISAAIRETSALLLTNKRLHSNGAASLYECI